MTGSAKYIDQDYFRNNLNCDNTPINSSRINKLKTQIKF